MKGPEGQQGGEDQDLADVKVNDEPVGGEGLANEGERMARLDEGYVDAGGRHAFKPGDIGDNAHES